MHTIAGYTTIADAIRRLGYRRQRLYVLAAQADPPIAIVRGLLRVEDVERLRTRTKGRPGRPRKRDDR